MNRIEIKPIGQDNTRRFAESQLQDLRQKLYSVLTANKIMEADVLRQACSALESMSAADREEHIAHTWGVLYLERAKPILHQIDTLEKSMQSKTS